MPGSVMAAADDGSHLLSLSIEELMNVQVTVASLFPSDNLHAPSSVSVVTERDWQTQGARRTSDAISHLPSIMLLPVSQGSDAMAIRGYASTASARGIATTLDGVRLNNFYFGTAQYDTPNINLGVLQRIEMIRGPASTIYGSDAFHGVLALHAFESAADQEQVSAEMGENGFYQSAARYSGSASNNVRLNLAAAASGQSDQELPYQDYAGTVIEKEQRYQSRSASLKLVSDSDSELAWRWGLYADEFDSRDFPYVSAANSSGQESSAYFTRLAVVKKLAQARSLEASGYYRSNDVDRMTSQPPANVLVQNDSHFAESASGVALTLRQNSTHSSATQWAVALGFDTQSMDEGTSFLRFANGQQLEQELGGVGKSRDISSLVFDADTRLDDARWGLVYGVRLDHYSDFGNQLSPRAGLIFLPEQQTAVKLLYGRAFRAPTAAELYLVTIGGFGSAGNPDLEPETIDTLELILMRQGSNWQGSVSLFGSEWRDAIVLDFSGNVGSYLNSGRNRAHGVETTWIWRPERWRVEFNAAYTDSHNVTQDRDYSLFPHFSANLLASYEIRALDSRITLASRYFGKVEDTPELGTNNPQPLDSYQRCDLNLTTRFGQQVEGFINVLNLFDRTNHLPSITGIQNGVTDTPLTFSIGFRYGY